jgi:hypothetical protein
MLRLVPASITQRMMSSVIDSSLISKISFLFCLAIDGNVDIAENPLVDSLRRS